MAMTNAQIELTHKLLRRIAIALEAQLAAFEDCDVPRVDADGQALPTGTKDRRAAAGTD